MGDHEQHGFVGWAKSSFWVIVADTIGFAFLLSLLLTAAGAPALKQWLFAFLTILPFIAALMLVATRRPKRLPAADPVALPVHTRKITVSPRPVEQRT